MTALRRPTHICPVFGRGLTYLCQCTPRRGASKCIACAVHRSSRTGGLGRTASGPRLVFVGFWFSRAPLVSTDWQWALWIGEPDRISLGALPIYEKIPGLRGIPILDFRSPAWLSCCGYSAGVAGRRKREGRSYPVRPPGGQFRLTVVRYHGP